MKHRMILGSVALVMAMTMAPVTSQAGGLDRLCPTHWLKRLHHHHYAAVPAKPAPKKKVVKVAAKKPAKPMK